MQSMISVIIPVYDERENLASLFEELRAAAEGNASDFQFIFVDDGSTDGSWEEIERLARVDGRIEAVRLRRNFGKTAALSAGIHAARGDYICTIDADGQDDPAEIANLVHHLELGLDVVSGWKRPRMDSWFRAISSRVFNFFVNRLTGVGLHDHNCGMKLYRAEVFREVHLYGGLHRLIPVLAHAKGFRVGECPVHHRPRQHGRSKYGAGRYFKGLIDLLTVAFLTSFGSNVYRPLGLFGFMFFLLGMLGMIYLAGTWVYRLWSPESFLPISQRPLLGYSMVAVLFGAQMMSIAFLAALITARDSRVEESYSVVETIGPRESSSESTPASTAKSLGVELHDGGRESIPSKT